MIARAALKGAAFFLTTVLTTVTTGVVGKKIKMNMKNGKEKSCNRCGYRILRVEVAGFEPAAFWSRTSYSLDDQCL